MATQTVYVVTKAEFLQPEHYVTVRGTAKGAEKFIRSQYPNARKDEGRDYDSYLCKSVGKEFLMFVHKETLVD